jgi:hypothetical protein
MIAIRFRRLLKVYASLWHTDEPLPELLPDSALKLALHGMFVVLVYWATTGS